MFGLFQFLFDITGSKNKYIAAAVLGFTQCANFVCKKAFKGNFMNPVLLDTYTVEHMIIVIKC